jgi:hypothetical protein
VDASDLVVACVTRRYGLPTTPVEKARRDGFNALGPFGVFDSA